VRNNAIGGYMKHFLVLSFLLLAINIFAQELVQIENRDQFELKLMINEETYYSSTIPASKYIVKPNEIMQLFPGDDIYIEATIENSKIILNKVYKTVDDKSKFIHLKFEQNAEGKNHKFMMLTISNPFEFEMTYAATILLLKNNKWIDTSTVPVRSKLQTFEMWDDIIISIALMNFKVKNE
jgi:hypothetical protein